MNCYICGGTLKYMGTMPFGKNQTDMPILDETPIEYYKCDTCSFICAPEMLKWSSEELGRRVYNEEYGLVDPGYGGVRAESNLAMFKAMFPNRYVINKIRHLDYGSGEGFLTEKLRDLGYKSEYYDPFTSPSRPDKTYNFITAIEVFEHSTNIFDTVLDIKSFLDRDGTILFTTNLADKDTPFSWWYILARSGHIGIHSADSLKIVAKKCGLFFSTEAENIHVLQRTRNDFKSIRLGAVK